MGRLLPIGGISVEGVISFTTKVFLANPGKDSRALVSDLQSKIEALEGVKGVSTLISSETSCYDFNVWFHSSYFLTAPKQVEEILLDCFNDG